MEPTENQCDCTATPISPVAGSRATMEKVWASGPRGAGGSWARAAPAEIATPRSVSEQRDRLFSYASSLPEAGDRP